MKDAAEINYIKCQAQTTYLLYLDISSGKQMSKQAQDSILYFKNINNILHVHFLV